GSAPAASARLCQGSASASRLRPRRQCRRLECCACALSGPHESETPAWHSWASASANSRQLFFSSRSRHTRLVSDWSSDVCSSDLYRTIEGHQAGFDGEFGLALLCFLAELRHCRLVRRGLDLRVCHLGVAIGDLGGTAIARSEERRVGKECRCRWRADREKTRGRAL